MINELIGKTVKEIKNSHSELRFICIDGSEYLMYHQQDCCENVRIEDLGGDLNDLINSPILSAYESTGNASSGTWTFYNISTKNGSCNIRWLGESNGYYSEKVTFEKIKDADIKNNIAYVIKCYNEIEAIFLNKENAEEFINEKNYWNKYEIEEIPILDLNESSENDR